MTHNEIQGNGAAKTPGVEYLKNGYLVGYQWIWS